MLTVHIRRISLNFLFFAVFLASAHAAAVGAGATMPEVRVPDWVSVKCSFDGHPEIGSSAGIECVVGAPLCDIEGRCSAKFPETVRSLSPAMEQPFKVKKGESATFRYPVQFVGESSAVPVSVTVRLRFPKTELSAAVGRSGAPAQAIAEARARLEKAGAEFTVTEKLDFTVTRQEGFSELGAGMYMTYLPSGYVISDNFASLAVAGAASVEAEIARTAELMSVIRGSDELKRYLDTQMDMVAGEDRYLRLIMSLANSKLVSGDAKAAAKGYGDLVEKAARQVRNVDTAEICHDAASNWAVAELLTPGFEKNGLQRLSKLIEAYTKSSDPRLRYVYYNMGIYHELAGKKKNAASEYRRALLVKPNFTACSARLKELEK